MISMRKLLKPLCAVMASAAVMSFAASVGAESEYKVYDYGEILEDSEETALEEQLCGIADMYGHDVIVYTAKSLNGTDVETRTEELVYELDAGINGSGIIYLVSMEERKYDIYAFGQMRDEIMIESIRDELAEGLQPYLSEGRYYDAFTEYGEKCEEEIIYVEQYGPNTEPSFALPIGIGIGAVIGLISVLVMKGQMNTVRAERMANNYIRKNSFRLDSARDIFLYSTVTRTRIASDSDSSSGIGGSDSGHSSGSF